jgi:hypothetical protein
LEELADNKLAEWQRQLVRGAEDKATEFNKQTEPLRIEQAKKVTSKFFFLPSQKWHFHSRTNQTWRAWSAQDVALPTAKCE